MTGARRRGADLSSREFQRILLVKPSSLGDVIHTLPVLHALRKRYPHARIDWLIGSAFAPILEGNKDVDGLILFDRRRFSRVGVGPGPTRDFLGLIGKLRSGRYDVVIDLQGLFRSGFLAWASGAPVRIGFQQAREAAAIFYTHKIPPVRGEQHAVDRYLSVGQLLGFTPDPVVFPVALDDETRFQARALLREHGLPEHERFVAISPGARWETKVWPENSFSQLLRLLAEQEPSVRCILLGGSEDTPLCDRLAGGAGNGALSLAGRTSIRQMAAMLERASAVVCHDSAPMHLAVALGRPLVCLTGPTNPARTGPYRRMHDCLRVPLECSPCYFRKLSQCPYDHRCMRELSVESVLTRVRSLIGPFSHHKVAEPAVEKVQMSKSPKVQI